MPEYSDSGIYPGRLPDMVAFLKSQYNADPIDERQFEWISLEEKDGVYCRTVLSPLECNSLILMVLQCKNNNRLKIYTRFYQDAEGSLYINIKPHRWLDNFAKIESFAKVTQIDPDNIEITQTIKIQNNVLDFLHGFDPLGISGMIETEIANMQQSLMQRSLDKIAELKRTGLL